MTAAVARRWVRFNAVGCLGFFVQMTALALLHGRLGMALAPATAIAVELAILNNFLWHIRWTWAHPSGAISTSQTLHRLWQFNLSSGVISILVNVALTTLLANEFHIHYLAANLLAIGLGALVNFAISEYVVFRPPSSASGKGFDPEATVCADAEK